MNGGNRASEITEAESTYAKATKAEFGRTYDSAFRLYIKAAELFLLLSRTTTQGERDKQKWQTQAGKALERADRIKKFAASSQKNGSGASDSIGPKTVLTPVGINHFAPQEQLFALKKGSRVNGQLFPLWDEPWAPSQTAQLADCQPPLSPEQRKAPIEWRRPHSEVNPSPTSALKIFSPILPQDIIQHIITDCSVCASISVCLEHARRFGSSLALASLHNPNGGTNTGTSSPDEYHLKLFFNGAWRRIVINDKLPYNSANNKLMCMSVRSSGPLWLWPSLLEKGYMKLMGGYDFPGSNSSIDLHVLTGWIPEHIEFRGSTFEREHTWKRILEGFTGGRCVFSLGTGPSTEIYWRSSKLLEMHSYAVIDVVENDLLRRVSVLDTWIESENDVARVLQMPWADVVNVFEGIYINWDPAPWSNVQTFHGVWRINEDSSDSSTSSSCASGSQPETLSTSHTIRLKFKNENESESEILILLTRHISDTSNTSDFISLRTQVQDEFLAASSVSISSQHSLTTRGSFTNSAHVLSRTRLSATQTSGTIAIHATYDGLTPQVGFTVTVYAPQGVTTEWDERITTPPFVKKAVGSFTIRNSGGNCSHPTFMLNPQYRLRVLKKSEGVSPSSTDKARVSFTLQSGRDLPVSFAVVWSQGERISELAHKDIVCSSGAYGYGLSRAAKDLHVGDYTLILSTFEPRQVGPYSLKVESSCVIDLEPILQEGAGMRSKVLRGAWENGTAGGSPSFHRYAQNPIFELENSAMTQAIVRLQIAGRTTSVPLNVAIYPANTLDSDRATATSGSYDDSISGVVIPKAVLSPGKYWIVPSTYNPGVEASFQLLLYTSTDVKVSQGQYRA
ncbi:cysteine proteinase [Pluteus cervinus]|uniref:Cysteine proteinase n=1 Tax=Pluteus cervinus TaxID=181527 RepID=A0ACD3B9V1_9AGAR|nr:cysteine proteinase [Pluteus cervinus]